MNPDLYALLPPEQQEEYKKLSEQSEYDGDLKLPEAHTYTSNNQEQVSLDELKTVLTEFHKNLPVTPSFDSTFQIDEPNFINYLFDQFIESERHRIIEYLHETVEKSYMRHIADMILSEGEQN